MKLTDAMTRAETAFRGMKEDSVSRKIRNLPSSVVVYRGDEHICTLHVPVDRQDLLTAVRAAAIGFNADVIVAAFETWASGPDWPEPRDVNPVTGERVGSGDLQDLVENNYGLERGWVVDALALSGINRAGDQDSTYLTYRMKGTRSMEWLPPMHPDGMTVGGAMPEAFAAIMRAVEPGLLAAEVIREAFPLATSYEAQRAIQDAMTITALRRNGGLDLAAVMLNAGEPGSERHEILSNFPT